MALQDIPPMKTKTLLTGTLSWLTTIPASYFVVADQLDYTHTLPTRGGEAGGSGLYLEVVELRCGTINESG